jgi:hypothetical protein
MNNDKFLKLLKKDIQVTIDAEYKVKESENLKNKCNNLLVKSYLNKKVSDKCIKSLAKKVFNVTSYYHKDNLHNINEELKVFKNHIYNLHNVYKIAKSIINESPTNAYFKKHSKYISYFETLLNEENIKRVNAKCFTKNEVNEHLSYTNNYISNLEFYKSLELNKKENNMFMQLMNTSTELLNNLSEVNKNYDKYINTSKNKKQDIGLIIGVMYINIEDAVNSYREKEAYKKAGIMGENYIKLKEKERLEEQKEKERLQEQKRDKSNGSDSEEFDDNDMSIYAAMVGATASMM